MAVLSPSSWTGNGESEYVPMAETEDSRPTSVLIKIFDHSVSPSCATFGSWDTNRHQHASLPLYLLPPVVKLNIAAAKSTATSG
ncbi:uncharacterized protein L203_103375 [Cryptococcus depauperatus CBS 7841]|uniref:Uncharacterized protein n=1 Tax=Cryptococcus depauperatus CBS 7841 TaxID=1295531 RepID=A0AAJ8JTQ3_9TREE